MVLEASMLLGKLQGLTNQETLSLLGTDVYLISFVLIFIIPLLVFIIPVLYYTKNGKIQMFYLVPLLIISIVFQLTLIILTIFGILPAYLNTL